MEHLCVWGSLGVNSLFVSEWVLFLLSYNSVEKQELCVLRYIDTAC